MVQRHSCNSVIALAWLLLIYAHPATAAGDPARGASQFQACMVCHSTEPDRHLTGPSLAHVWGSKAGTAKGFSRYSDALKKSGIVWNEETLDKWLGDPAGFVPGNGMTFPGIKDTRARQDLIAYLRAVSEGKAPKAPASGMGMMMGGNKPNLKEANPKDRVTALRYCGDTYFVTTADGQVHKFWEFNLRFKTDSSADGPPKGKPAIVGAGMRGDRASVIFASPSEINTFIKTSCE